MQNRKKANSQPSKVIFIAYNHKDKVVARFIYHRLVKENWFNIEVFMDEFSIKPGKDIKTECVKKAKTADLGIVILSEYIQKSDYASQEIGILLSREIPKIYISLHQDWMIPPGYEKTIKSFPLHEERNPFEGLAKLIELVKEYLKPKEIGVIEIVNKAFKLNAQGKFEDALELYEKAILRDPNYDSPYFIKITNLRKLGRYDEAIQAADAALEKFPNHIEILSRKGFVLYSLKKYAEAINVYDKIILLDTANLNAMYYKGECLNNQRKFNEALTFFKEVYRRKPDSKLGKKALRRIIMLQDKTKIEQ